MSKKPVTPREKPNAVLRAALRKKYLYRCLFQAVFAGIGSGAAVFLLQYLVAGMPKQVWSYVIAALIVLIGGWVYGVWAYGRIKKTIVRFKGVASPKAVFFDGFAVLRDRVTKKRMVGWLFLTDRGLYVLPLSRREEAYFSIKLTDITVLEPAGRYFAVCGGVVDGRVFTYDNEAVVNLITERMTAK